MPCHPYLQEGTSLPALLYLSFSNPIPSPSPAFSTRNPPRLAITYMWNFGRPLGMHTPIVTQNLFERSCLGDSISAPASSTPSSKINTGIPRVYAKYDKGQKIFRDKRKRFVYSTLGYTYHHVRKPSCPRHPPSPAPLERANSAHVNMGNSRRTHLKRQAAAPIDVLQSPWCFSKR